MGLLALLTILAHAPGLTGQFLYWDDDTHVTQNLLIRELTWENVRAMFTQPVAKLYVPLTWLSFALDYQLWGQTPFGYHLTNLLLHTANTVLVFVLMLGLVGAASPPRPGQRIAAGTPLPPQSVAFLTAAIFGVHPLRVESVAWITERKDVLFAFFYLLGLLAYLRRRIAIVFVCFVAAALAKAAAVTFPVVLVLLDVFVYRRRAWLEKIPFVIVSLVIGFATLFAQGAGVGETVASTEAIPILARLGLLGYCSLFYVGKFFCPADLSAVYPTFDEMNWSRGHTVGYLLAFVAVTALIVALRRRVPVLLPAWLFYLVTLSPTIGLLPVGIHVVADRYAYLPVLGLALAMGCVVRYRVASLVVVLVLALAALTSHRTRVWHDTESLFQSVLAKDPRCLPAHINLTKWYMDTGQLDKAIAHGRRAVEIAPNGLPGRRNLAAALRKAGRAEEAAALER